MFTESTLSKISNLLKRFPAFVQRRLYPRHRRRCKITGIDISDQRPDSVFVSEKKVGYYKAHQVRNKDSNPRNHLRQRIEKILDQPSLFDQKKVIKLTDEQKELLEFWNGTEYEIKL